MKEKTSCSNSAGLHFGMFKSGVQSKTIADFEATMSNIPYCTGFAPSRWTQATNVMIEKKDGNRRVDKLRTIVLFEPDFNFNNKKMGRDTMNHAEKYSLLAEEQFGGRKKKTAIDHAVNKRLTYDLCRQSRQPTALCSQDAKACYDRVAHNVASLCLQRLGMPTEPIICMFSTLQRLDYSNVIRGFRM